MKVYIVFEDNGFVYEDYLDWIVKVFVNKEQAKRFLNNEIKKQKRKYSNRPYYEEHGFRIEEHKIEDTKNE